MIPWMTGVSAKIRMRGIAALSLAGAFALIALGVARAESDVPLPRPAPKAAQCDRGHFRVVLDVGHSAEAPGAISARGLTEYGFNLRLAKQIDRSLTVAGFDKTVLMITGGNAKRTLYLRMARANKLSADLLLSIHHDSVPDKFYKKWEFDGKPRIYNDEFKGHSIFVSEDNVDGQQSLMFASMLGEQLKASGLQYTPHYTEKFMGRNRHPLLDAIAGVYRYDALFVLKKARMPAALLEAGSIVNRDEELTLETPERQQLIGAAVVAAVDGFCAAQARKPETQVAQHRQTRQVVQHAQTRHALSAHSRRHGRERTATEVTAVSQSTFDMH
jgi:N-acetylmuramoyl-L-alanine amidase